MRRRSVAAAIAAGVGLVAGGGTALWRSRSSSQATETAAETTEPQDIWALQFEQLSGATLSMRALRGKPLLLNFWATWCVPCVTEMPMLDAFSRAQAAAGWQLLALAVDPREAVERFLVERQLELRVALAGSTGIDLSRSLGNRVGALPFTAVFDSRGTQVGQRLGALDEKQLAEWARTVS